MSGFLTKFSFWQWTHHEVHDRLAWQKENIYLQISLQQLELLKIKGLKFWEL